MRNFIFLIITFKILSLQLYSAGCTLPIGCEDKEFPYKFCNSNNLLYKCSKNPYNEWENLKTSAYCWYDNNIAHKNPYGALYNWFKASQPNICPEGWHVPTDAEWTQLATFLGDEAQAGGKLKEAGTKHWQAPNSGATNEVGFTALPGGGRGVDFSQLGTHGFWWSSTKNEPFKSSWYRMMGAQNRNVLRHHLLTRNGYCIRCVKD